MRLVMGWGWPKGGIGGMALPLLGSMRGYRLKMRKRMTGGRSRGGSGGPSRPPKGICTIRNTRDPRGESAAHASLTSRRFVGIDQREPLRLVASVLYTHGT